VKVGVVIGRFQPYHLHHKRLVDMALDEMDKVLIMVGDTGCARDFRNPWWTAEVVDMIGMSHKEDLLAGRLMFASVQDQPYDDEKWVESVRNAVASKIPVDAKVRLFGFQKDSTSFYLDLFPDWGLESIAPIDRGGLFDATAVRRMLFARMKPSKVQFDWLLERSVPYGTMQAIERFAPSRAEQMEDQLAAIERHDADWASKGARDYGVQHVAVDVFLHTEEKVLLIERGGDMGGGTLALPGGFVNAGERLVDAALRELREETGISLPQNRERLFRSHGGVGLTVAFDHPQRSMRGRIFTNVLPIRVPEEIHPTAGDDARSAFWVNKSKLSSFKPSFFSDHYHIANHFVGGTLT
jgi:bifunctional NMN adenylyltransferase/nudix hydrolase